jgi:hypothetical protein
VKPLTRVAIGLVGLGVWALGSERQALNYDEVLRAHSLWMTAHGQRPYRDFFEVHPPYFRLLSWMAVQSEDPGASMSALRRFAGVGNGLFLVGVWMLAKRRSSEIVAALVVFGLACGAAADFLVEFRVDGWGWAAVLWPIVLWDRRRKTSNDNDTARLFARSLLTGATAGIAVVLLNPKAALLLPSVAATTLLTNGSPLTHRLARAAPPILGMAVGVVLALVGLWASGEDLRILFDSTVRFNAMVNAHGFHGFGLGKRLLADPIGLTSLLLTVVMGIAAWRNGDATAAGIAVWLSIQPVLVGSPYKQYAAPWLLLTAPFWAQALHAGGRRLPGVVPLAGFAVAIVTVASTARWMQDRAFDRHVAAIRWLQAAIPADDYVVGSPPYHPISRRDAFDLCWNTLDPHGRDAEWIFERMTWASAKLTDDAYREQLRRRPPALVVVRSEDMPEFYPRRQRAVLNEYVVRCKYRIVQAHGLTVAVRPDLAEPLADAAGRLQ